MFYKSIISLLLASFTLTSCAPIMHPVAITTQPEGAAIYVDNCYCGETPQRVLMRKDRCHDIWLVKEGCEAEYIEVNPLPTGTEGLGVCIAIMGVLMGLSTGDPCGAFVCSALGIATGAAVAKTGVNDHMEDYLHVDLIQAQ